MNWPANLDLVDLNADALPILEDQILLFDIERPNVDYLKEFPWIRSRLKNSHNTPQKAMAQLLLRQLLALYVSEEPHDIRFEYSKKGKPYLKNTPLYFNSSDTKDDFFIALSKHKPIGLDIESSARSFNHTGISQRYMTESELRTYSSLAREEQRLWALYAWTRNEALGKSMGVGIQYKMAETATMSGFPKGTTVKYENKDYHIRSWNLPLSRLIGSTAVEGTERPINAIHIGAIHWQKLMQSVNY